MNKLGAPPDVTINIVNNTIGHTSSNCIYFFSAATVRWIQDTIEIEPGYSTQLTVPQHTAISASISGGVTSGVGPTYYDNYVYNLIAVRDSTWVI
jgi:hypothetical protein